jgi:hypothetical protein
MASGYFPLQKHDDAFRKIDSALLLLKSASSEMNDCVYSGGLNSEDAAIDGSYLETISRAISGLSSCLETHVSPESVILDAQRILATYIVPDSGISDRDAINLLLELLDGPKARAAMGVL